MKTSETQPFNLRKFISVCLFFTLVTLITTGTLIQVFEATRSEFPAHFSTAVHVLTGLIFAVVAIIHTVINWRALKAHIKAKRAIMGSETVISLCIIAALVLTGFIVAFSFF